MAAQHLLMQYTTDGDIRPLLDGYFDPATVNGTKTDKSSYVAIAKQIGQDPKDCLFLSDVVGEISAALESGMEAALVLRPGNKEVSKEELHKYLVLDNSIENI